MAHQATLPKQLRTRDRERLRAYAKNLAFYNGNQWPTRTNNQRTKRLTFNYTKPIIHKTTSSLLTGRATVVSPTDDTAAALEHADLIETALAQVADQNALPQLDFDTELDAAVLGDGAYKVWWDNERIRVVAPDPSGIWAWAWPDDPSRIWRVAHQYKLDPAAAQSILNLTNAGVAALGTKTVTITDDWTADTFQRWVNEHDEPQQLNTFGLIPFVIFPNIREPQQLWGTSDIPSLMEPQREINRSLSQISNIMELSGNPIAVLEGVTEAQDIAVQPGQIWELPEKTKAYVIDLLAGGGANLMIDALEAAYRTLYDLAETPRSAFGGQQGAISGVALELDLDPLVKKIERKRLLRAAAYTQRNEIILSLLTKFTDLPPAAPASHDVAWGSILPADRDRDVANEVAIVSARIHSRTFAADALGGIDDPDAELDRINKEERETAANTPAPTN